MNDYAAARRNMVLSQLEPNRVHDRRILDAMGAIPREVFAPKSLAGVAYLDEDLEIAPGRYLMEPMVLARLIEALDIRDGDLVLDVGCGTGYAAAVLSRLAGTVVAVENDAELAAKAGDNLSKVGIDNVAIIEGPLTDGRVDQGPFAAILIDGGVEDVPPALLAQLAPGGRLACVVRSGPTGKAILYSETGGVIGHRPLFDSSIPPLPGFAKPKVFAFQ
ncbi:MAG: protein-L-isoaspartate O-methyltransferase [Proteobacteria bacterium]|nr:protein-L-isoaspartate O-methyltransferase [Pseudomonadota bacterium]MDA1059843.1 protein-L-isoaspartate O-methyltransferase [Pseudomonadota bacterium]